MSNVQKTMMKGSPDLRARMEDESRKWMLQCQRCGFEQSVWDSGGVRYKAAGTSRNYRRCPHCGQWNWMKIYLPKGPHVPATPSGPPMPATANSRFSSLPWPFILGLTALVIVGVALLVTGILFVVNGATQPVVTAGDSFMTALKAGDYTQAYALCAPDLQKELGSMSGLATLEQNHQPAQWNWSSRSIRNDVGLLDGSFTYTDGKAGTMHLVFSRVNNSWKVTTFRFNPN